MDLPVQVKSSALEQVVSVFLVVTEEKRVLQGYDSSHPRLCPNNCLAVQIIRNNVVKVSSEQHSCRG